MGQSGSPFRSQSTARFWRLRWTRQSTMAADRFSEKRTIAAAPAPFNLSPRSIYRNSRNDWRWVESIVHRINASVSPVSLRNLLTHWAPRRSIRAVGSETSRRRQAFSLLRLARGNKNVRFFPRRRHPAVQLSFAEGGCPRNHSSQTRLKSDCSPYNRTNSFQAEAGLLKPDPRPQVAAHLAQCCSTETEDGRDGPPAETAVLAVNQGPCFPAP